MNGDVLIATGEKKVVATRLSDEEIKDVINRLLEMRSEALFDFGFCKGALSNEGNGTDDTSPQFKVLEEGNKTMEKETNGKLTVAQKKKLELIDNALVRAKNKTIGICLHSGCRCGGGLIEPERFKANPLTTKCSLAKVATGSTFKNQRN